MGLAWLTFIWVSRRIRSRFSLVNLSKVFLPTLMLVKVSFWVALMFVKCFLKMLQLKLLDMSSRRKNSPKRCSVYVCVKFVYPVSIYAHPYIQSKATAWSTWSCALPREVGLRAWNSNSALFLGICEQRKSVKAFKRTSKYPSGFRLVVSCLCRVWGVV